MAEAVPFLKTISALGLCETGRPLPFQNRAFRFEQRRADRDILEACLRD